MITDELKYRIHETFGYMPTAEQEQAIDVFTTFMADRRDEAVLLSLQQSLVLLAPTGRAAKVFSLYAACPASTIHRRIYRQKSLEGGFSLSYNAAHDTLFIVDEASMIANGDTPLLDDLIQFVYNGRNCRLMLLGDHAQLPPDDQRVAWLWVARLRLYAQRGASPEPGVGHPVERHEDKR